MLGVLWGAFLVIVESSSRKFCEYFDDFWFILGASDDKKHCKMTFGAPEGLKLSKVVQM